MLPEARQPVEGARGRAQRGARRGSTRPGRRGPVSRFRSRAPLPYHDRMPTRRILHYQILERLGAGAMGEVFLAEDTRLGRRVVLKFLALPETEDDAARARLEREARSLAALSHPHIARVFALENADDTTFLVMEYVDGETLAEVLSLGPLAAPEVAHIGASLAGALAQAHGRGVVHRDIKPENILITEDGHVRLADFGIASLRGGGGGEPEGLVWGTPEYMCPEQASGRTSDGRCDLYSLGVVLIEALTGEPPRADEEPQAALVRMRAGARPASDPSQVAPPTPLERVLAQCVERDPDLRPRDAATLHADLARIAQALDGPTRPAPRLRALWITAAAAALLAALATWFVLARPDRAPGPAAAPRSIAVSPIEVSGGQRSDAYVGRAFSQAVAVGLTRVTNLRVLAGAESVGRGADLVVGGRLVREHGMNHARVSVLESRSGRVLWSGDRDADDRQLPYLASAVANEIARALHAPPTKLYDYYLYSLRSEALGRSPIASATLGALRRSDTAAGLRWSAELVKAFPRESEAHVLRAYALLGKDWTLRQDLVDRRLLREELGRVRELDPADPWAEAFEGLLAHRDGHVVEAERCFGVALARDDLTPAARGFLLSLRGQALRDLDRPGAALADLDEASRLDPTNVITLVIHADALGVAGHSEEGLVRARQAIALDPDASYTVACMAQCLARAGRWTEAVPYIEMACHRQPVGMNLALGALILRRAGRIEDAEAQLKLAEAAPPSDWGDFTLARYHALVGDRAGAMRLLREAVRLGYCDPEVQTIPEFDPLRPTPEFQALLATMRRRWAPPEPLASPTQ